MKNMNKIRAKHIHRIPAMGRRKFFRLSNFQFSEHIHCDLWDKHIKIRISQNHLNILQIKWESQYVRLRTHKRIKLACKWVQASIYSVLAYTPASQYKMNSIFLLWHGMTSLGSAWLSSSSFGWMLAHFAIPWISISLSLSLSRFHSSFLIAYVCAHTIRSLSSSLVHRCVLGKIMYPAIEDRTWIDDGCYLKNHFRSSVDDFYGRFFFFCFH